MNRRVSLLLTMPLLAGLIMGLMPVVNAAPASAITTTANGLLSRLTFAGEAGDTTYSRTYFKTWIDADGDCQDTRAEVLIAESKVTPRFTTTRHCTVAAGSWYSYYDATTWTAPGDVDIDHMVPLKEAWVSGARLWSVTNRTRYANDLGMNGSLLAVTDNVNQSKGDRDPAEWMPPSAAAQCAYAIQWVQVKYRWRLTVNRDEHTKLSAILSGTCGARAATVPPRAI